MCINSYFTYLRGTPIQPGTPPQPPSDKRSICWVKTIQPSTKSANKGDIPCFTAYNGKNNCHLTFYSFKSSPNYRAKLTPDAEDANQVDTLKRIM